MLKNNSIPDTIEELAKFVLVGRDLVDAVRSEIRVIDKLKLAEEVRNQKRQEISMLSETLLDAEVRLGELFQQLPKNPGARTDKQPRSADETRLKEEVIRDLGFSKSTAHRLEILADNTNIVEFVKAESRENGEIPTRARVLELAVCKNKQDAEQEKYFKFLDDRVKIYKELSKIIELIDSFKIDDYRMDALRDNFDHILTVENEIGYIESAKDKLTAIELEIRKQKKHRFSKLI
jgi:hypothetical protein